jgi:hypothetical protein
MTPNKNPKKSSSKLRQQRAPKITTKKDGKTLHNLEEQRRTIYTYHEGSYKVWLATHTSIPLS